MLPKKIYIRYFVIVACLFGFTITSFAQVYSYAEIAAVMLDDTNAIEKTSDLSFGNIIPSKTGEGQVKIGNNGSVSYNQCKAPELNQGTISAASFLICGASNSHFSPQISSPVTLSNGSGGTMTVDSFTPSTYWGTIGQDGTYILTVGATLKVNAKQAAGDYTGQVTVTASFN